MADEEKADRERALRSFNALQSELERIPKERLVRGTLSGVRAMERAGIMNGLVERSRGALDDTFKRVPPELEQLIPRGQAMWIADIRLSELLALPKQTQHRKDQQAEAKRLRDLAIKVLDALGATDNQLQASLASIRRGRGRRDRANDLLRLYHLLDQQRERIEASGLLPPGTLDQINTLTPQLLETRDPSDVRHARDIRNRAFTYLREAMHLASVHVRCVMDLGLVEPAKLPSLAGR
jgi:hypothetical protein